MNARRRHQAMHRALRAAMLVGALSGAIAGGLAQAAPAVGKAPPDFTLAGSGQTQVQLAQLKGKVVYLDFWASWCPACQQALPWLDAMQSRYGARGFQVVAINVDQKREDAESFLAAHPLKLLLAFDPANRTPRAYNIRTMPASLLIGADGKVRVIHEGFEPLDTTALEGAIKAALEASAGAAP